MNGRAARLRRQRRREAALPPKLATRREQALVDRDAALAAAKQQLFRRFQLAEAEFVRERRLILDRFRTRLASVDAEAARG